MHLLTGKWLTQLVGAVARLGIPDQLAIAQPQTAEQLAASVGAHPGAMRRVMRALAMVGVFAEAEGGRYILTPISERLRSNTPDSMRDLFLLVTQDSHWLTWGHLVDAIRTGQPQPQAVFGMPLFDYYSTHASEADEFGRAMQNLSAMVTHGTLANYDFSHATLIVDVGGGNGSFVRAILQHHPRPRGIIVDLPYMEAQAHESIRVDALTDRCGFESGDFFRQVPSGGDIYLLKMILHDWNDEDCVRVLRSCHAAIAPLGRLVVVEILVPEDNAPGFAQLGDINMLVVAGGQERTQSEYSALFDRAGFRLTRVIATGTISSIIEAKPV
jgi:hypothetical protein